MKMKYAGWGIGGFVSVLIVKWLITSNPAFLQTVFCRPTAFVVQCAIGGELSISELGIPQVITSTLKLSITNSCSGASFFSLLCMVIWIGLYFSQRFQSIYYLLTVPMAYILTIATNSSRVISAYSIAPYLPDSVPFEISHQAVGIAVFLPVLIGVYILLTYKTNQEVGNEK